jgi:hypothetical protein
VPREQWYYDERQRVSAAWFFDPIGVSFPVLISGGALRDPRLPSFTAPRWLCCAGPVRGERSCMAPEESAFLARGGSPERTINNHPAAPNGAVEMYFRSRRLWSRWSGETSTQISHWQVRSDQI